MPSRASQPDSSPLVLSLDTAPTRPMRLDRGVQLQLFNPGTGAQRLDFHVNILNVGSGPGPYHFHERAENIYFVLDGTAQVIVEGVRHVLNAGDAALIPPGARHCAGNGGLVPARVIEIYAPAGDDFNIVDDPQAVVAWIEPK